MDSSKSQLDSPIAFFVFNRPEQTRRVFEEIKKARPKTLLVVADGPRPAKFGEDDLCKAVRQIVNSVDWPCEVERNFADENLGCKVRVSSGLDWVFSKVETAIILEDDCLPEQSFFSFCHELLERYRNDERVMQICGSNFYPKPNNLYSYTFTKFGPIWGWATWKRAWQLYDVNMSAWPKVRGEELYYNFWEVPCESEFRIPMYEDIYRGKVDTWDLQWSFAKFINSGLCIMPATNLIKNIGFGVDATHTSDAANELAALESKAVDFPLNHYPFVTRDWETDRRIAEKTGPKHWLIQNHKLRMASHPIEFLTAEGYSKEIQWSVRENFCCACGSSILKQSQENSLYKVCMDCGSYVLAQFIIEEQLGLLYGKTYWYEHQEAIGSPNIEQRHQSDMLDRIPHWLECIKKIKNPPAKVLEIGCAHGRLLLELAKIGYAVTGFEYSEDIATVAKKLSGIDVVNEIPDNLLFDIVIANDVLEHIYQPDEFLVKISDILEPDGKLFTQVPTTINGQSINKSLRPYYHTFIYSAACLDILANKSFFCLECMTLGMFDTYDVVWSKNRACAVSCEKKNGIIELNNVWKDTKQKIKKRLRTLCQTIIQRYLS